MTSVWPTSGTNNMSSSKVFQDPGWMLQIRDCPRHSGTVGAYDWSTKKSATHTCVCSLIKVRILRITSYTIIEDACLLFLLTCHESRCFCHDREHLCHNIRGGCPLSRSSPAQCSIPMAFFGLLLNRYSVVETQDLTCIILTILREWSSRALFTCGFDISNLPRKLCYVWSS